MIKRFVFLGTERLRITELLKKGDTFFDVFAGVGPFAIPAASNKCTVYANDLNPESYKWLKTNCKLNKVPGVHCYNMDGRDFIRQVVKNEVWKLMTEGGDESATDVIHIIMNLPAIAVEFLDVFYGLFADVDPSLRLKAFTIHVYCYAFVKAEQDLSEVTVRVEKAVGAPIGDVSVTFVRNVAPYKDMIRVSFVLPDSILFAKHDSDGEPASKRQCIENLDATS